MAKEIQLKTKRLLICPMSPEELDKKVQMTEDADLKQAYTEMLTGCRNNPDQKLWYTAWKILLRSDGTEIGDAGFKGGPIRGAVEIGYGIEDAFRGKGYMTEAAGALVEWAFGQNGVYVVHAQTEEGNAASRRVLEKLDFKPNGQGSEGLLFSREKPAASYMSIYMCLGMSIGISLGASLHQMPVWMPIGILMGMALGMSLDSAEKKKRKEVMEGNQEFTKS